MAFSTSSGSTEVSRQAPQGRVLCTASTGLGSVASTPATSSFSHATATTAGANDAWHLRGPGIQEVAALQVDGLPDDFEAQWAANHGVFPRGVDLLLATADHIVGLPRTTRATRGATALQEA